MKVLFGVVLCLASVATCKELPSYIPVCKRDSATVSQCLKMAATVLQPRLASGIKEINIPPLEPLEIPMIKLEQGTGAVSYRATLTKLKVHGLSNYKFENLKANLGSNGFKITGRTDLPRIRLVADYDIGGKVLLLPIQGNGVFTANITDTVANILTTGVVSKKKGGEYLSTKDTQIHLQIGNAMIHFGNLFNGDPVLSTTTNNFFNENAKDIINEVKPAIEAVTSMLVDDIVNKVFRSTPYDKLFPK